MQKQRAYAHCSCFVGFACKHQFAYNRKHLYACMYTRSGNAETTHIRSWCVFRWIQVRGNAPQKSLVRTTIR